jgi:hypothetical protein
MRHRSLWCAVDRIPTPVRKRQPSHSFKPPGVGNVAPTGHATDSQPESSHMEIPSDVFRFVDRGFPDPFHVSGAISRMK